MATKLTWVSPFAALLLIGTAFFAHAEDTVPRGTGTTTGSSRASAGVRGILIATDHRMKMTAFAESLEYIAQNKNNPASMSSTARSLARQSEEEIPVVTQAIQKTATRGTLARALFGNDYEQVTVIKKELERLKEALSTLEALRGSARSASDQAIIKTQIQLVSDHYATIERFVDAYERSYGALGWFNKIAASAPPQKLATSPIILTKAF